MNGDGSMKRAIIAALALGWAAALPGTARAHLRNFLDTYGYDTLEKGAAEVESFTDNVHPRDGGNFWQNATELELGLTNRWSLGLYGVFVDGQGATAWKAENRVRFAEAGKWPVDTAAYLEYKGGIRGKEDDEVETKLIFSKHIDRWNVVANPLVEFERETDPSTGEKEWEATPGLALGVAYAPKGGRVTPGLELFLRKDETRITPGLYITVLPEVRLNLGLSVGLDGAADKTQLRSMLEIEF